MSITYAFWLGLCVLHRTYRQDYETLFHVVILSKHHHHQFGGEGRILGGGAVYAPTPIRSRWLGGEEQVTLNSSSQPLAVEKVVVMERRIAAVSQHVSRTDIDSAIEYFIKRVRSN
jgi:hypothetical protein